jgi:hypothetical protein
MIGMLASSVVDLAVLWDSPCSSMGLSLQFYGTPLAVLWDSPWGSMGLPLGVNLVIIVSRQVSHFSAISCREKVTLR